MSRGRRQGDECALVTSPVLLCPHLAASLSLSRPLSRLTSPILIHQHHSMPWPPTTFSPDLSFTIFVLLSVSSFIQCSGIFLNFRNFSFLVFLVSLHNVSLISLSSYFWHLNQCLTGTRYPTRPDNFWQYPIHTRFIFRIIGYFGYRVFHLFWPNVPVLNYTILF